MKMNGDRIWSKKQDAYLLRVMDELNETHADKPVIERYAVEAQRQSNADPSIGGRSAMTALEARGRYEVLIGKRVTRKGRHDVRPVKATEAAEKTTPVHVSHQVASDLRQLTAAIHRLATAIEKKATEQPKAD